MRTTAGVTISAMLTNASLRSSAGRTALSGICGSLSMTGMDLLTPVHPNPDAMPSPKRKARAV